MKPLIRVITGLVSGLVFIWSPVTGAELSAYEIVQKMLDRDDGRSSYSQNQLMSCRYKLTNGRYKCSSKPRVKLSEGISKDTGENAKDTINLNLIIKPASEKGMTFLQHDYDAEEKDSEQWMYLPAMKKLKRIVSETDDGPKTGTLFGSEIAYEDIEKRHINDATYELLGEETFNKRKVWKIKSTPTPKQARKSSYAYTLSWVDQERFMASKFELYDRQGKLKKTFLEQKVENHNGIWVARQMMVINHSNQRMSLMRISRIELNIDVPDALLGTRALNDASYRETQLRPIREKAK
ncbi:MAG: outer membrane lipoprotein-sorting protein [Gammaproteobacteria bacterium]|nr:outer membrane lipoprotein-sorting protein [Gammaproteobacteria bacterium]